MKKIAILLAALLTLAGGAWFVLTALIVDGDEIAAQLRQSLAEATGREVTLGGKVEVAFFPSPKLTVDGLYVANLDGASHEYVLSSPQMTISLGFGELVSGEAQPSAIELANAELNLEVLPNGRKNWDFPRKDGKQAELGGALKQTPVRFTNGRLNFVNAATGAMVELSDIEGTALYADEGRSFRFDGEFSRNGKEIKTLVESRKNGSNGGDPLKVTLKQFGVELVLEGQMGSREGNPEFQGNLDLRSANLWAVLGLFSDRPHHSADGEAGKISAKGKITLSLEQLLLEEVAVADAAGGIPTINGRLNAEYRFSKAPYLRLQPDFETIDLDYLISSYFSSYPATQDEAGKEPSHLKSLAQFLQAANGVVDARAASLIYEGRSINGVILDAAITPGRMTIREARASMPGDTRMVFAGVAVNKSADALALDGRFEIQGRELEQFMALFTPRDVVVPPMDLGMFGIRANLSLDEGQMRFSEFQARVADTRMAGAVILHRGERPRLESYLRIADINLDNLGKAFMFMLPKNQGVTSAAAEGDAGGHFSTLYHNSKFDWLLKAGIDINSDFLIQNFVLFERKGGRAEFALKLQPGSVALNNLRAEYNGAQIAGGFGLRAEQGQNPFIHVDANISELDMVDLFPDIVRERNLEEWQAYINEPMDLMLLQTYRADIKARIGKLRIRNYTFDNLATEITLANNRLNIDKFAGFLWGGGVNIRASVEASTIPSMAAAFVLENTNLVQMSEATRLLQHAAGNVSLQGQLTTSGMTPRSWMTNAKGQARVTGKEISVQGFGISGLSRAVQVARQVRDIETARDLALRGGLTRISELQGLINVDGGKISTPDISYTAEESRGNISGGMGLIDETVDLSMRFSLRNTEEQGETTPVITLTLRGGIDNIKKTLDTQQLENYVSQRAAARALGRE